MDNKQRIEKLKEEEYQELFGIRKGSVHDFELFKQSGLHLLADILLLGDKGFQGICYLHAFSVTPFKKPRKGELTPEQKAFNRSLAIPTPS